MQTKHTLIDSVLASTYPLIPMPHNTESFVPLQKPGCRLILANDGLYTEVRRAWLYARFRTAPVATPYGPLKEMCASLYKPGRVDIDRFEQQARSAGEIETAAWVIWNENTRATRYLECNLLQANAVHLEIDRPVLAAGEHLVLDMHSHHHMNAFFSNEDDEDDLASRECKFAAVVGKTDQPQAQWKLRLCVEGHVLHWNGDGMPIAYGELP